MKLHGGIADDEGGPKSNKPREAVRKACHLPRREFSKQYHDLFCHFVLFCHMDSGVLDWFGTSIPQRKSGRRVNTAQLGA